MRIAVERRQALDATTTEYLFSKEMGTLFFCIFFPSAREPSVCLQMALVTLWMRSVMLSCCFFCFVSIGSREGGQAREGKRLQLFAFYRTYRHQPTTTESCILVNQTTDIIQSIGFCRAGSGFIRTPKANFSCRIV